MIKNEQKEIKNLIKLSKYAGERFDLVQSAGGNTSIKLNKQIMLIKSSGVSLSDLSINHGYSKVDNDKIIKIFQNKIIKNTKRKKFNELLAQKLLKKVNLNRETKPSIEVFLHSFLDKVTLHTHPICVLNILCRKDSEQIIKKIFNKKNFLFIKYKTPGIELALELKKKIQLYLMKKNFLPKIIFLENHGLIINDNNINKVMLLNEKVIIKIEKFLKINYTNYKIISSLSKLVRKILKNNNLITYYSEDIIVNNKKFIKKYLFSTPSCPDVFVFNGFVPCKLNAINDYLSIVKFRSKHGMFPKVFYYKSKIFFINSSVRRAKTMEEMMKFHFLSLSKTANKVQPLSKKELKYLSNMASEKYRQNI